MQRVRSGREQLDTYKLMNNGQTYKYIVLRKLLLECDQFADQLFVLTLLNTQGSRKNVRLIQKNKNTNFIGFLE